MDGGRPRTRSLGVPLGGAADRTALALGNGLVGNPPATAALEVCLSGPTLLADVDLACVLFGAPFEVFTDRRNLLCGQTFTLRACETLSVGGTPAGMRAYLCVRGGLRGPVVLDSVSSLRPLTAGTELGCEPGVIPGRRLAGSWRHEDDPTVLRVLPGAQADWFPDGVFQRRSFLVTPASNRMGLRLQSEPLPTSGREMVSEPVCPGSVQVTRDGQCIVLGVDGQTIGGYPKVAQVIAADVDRLGQLRPGQPLLFQSVTVAEAETRFQEQQRELNEWLVRLTTQ